MLVKFSNAKWRLFFYFQKLLHTILGILVSNSHYRFLPSPHLRIAPLNGLTFYFSLFHPHVFIYWLLLLSCLFLAVQRKIPWALTGTALSLSFRCCIVRFVWNVPSAPSLWQRLLSLCLSVVECLRFWACIVMAAKAEGTWLPWKSIFLPVGYDVLAAFGPKQIGQVFPTSLKVPPKAKNFLPIEKISPPSLATSAKYGA